MMRYIRTAVSEDYLLGRSGIGNISSANLNGSSTSRMYNNVHALTSLGASSQSYDSDGNATTLHTGVTLDWDDAGRVQATHVGSSATAGIEGDNEYGYLDGKKIWRKITRGGSVVTNEVYIYAGPNRIAEYSASQPATNPLRQRVFADGIDSLSAIVQSNGNVLIPTRNRQWSIIALTSNSTGSALERYAYNIYGTRTILTSNGTTVRPTSTYTNNYGYTSREQLPESGLMYFRARHYDQTFGEFLSKDLMEFVDGTSLYRAYFVPSMVDFNGRLAISPLLASSLKLSDEWENDTGVGTDPWIVTDLYCEAAEKYPKNGWLKCACDVSGDIDDAIRLIDFSVWWFKAYDSAAADKSKWFKCTRTCMQKRWFEAVQNQEDESDLLQGSEWGDWCKNCSINSDSLDCCEQQVEAEQSELQNCMKSCGNWNYGDSFPIGMIPGFEGDFNVLKDRITFANRKCCNSKYYPKNPYEGVDEDLGYDPRHQPWGWGPKY